MADDLELTIWFVGDLDDPWVTSIADAITIATPVRVSCPGDLPDDLFDSEHPPHVVVLHRSRLTRSDASRLEKWTQSGDRNPLPRKVLCINPYVRYEELERWSTLVDLIIPEATAPDLLPRHLAALLEGRSRIAPLTVPRDSFRLSIVSDDHELRTLLCETCAEAGYSVTPDREEAALSPRRNVPGIVIPDPVRITIWDVPVLERDWPREMERKSRSGPLIALLGFADRETVRLAKSNGAAACLDVPFDLDDLSFVLDRVVSTIQPDPGKVGTSRAEPPHAYPPPPVGRRSRSRLPTSEASEAAPGLPMWSEGSAEPRIDADSTS